MFFFFLVVPNAVGDVACIGLLKCSVLMWFRKSQQCKRTRLEATCLIPTLCSLLGTGRWMPFPAHGIKRGSFLSVPLDFVLLGSVSRVSASSSPPFKKTKELGS